MKQSGRAILADRLRAALRAQGEGASMRSLSLKAGCSENMVERILAQPERATERETWEKLARYLGWDLDETLGLAGYGQAPEPAGDDPDLLLERAMELWALDDDVRKAMRLLAHLGRRVASPPSPSTPEPPDPPGGAPPSAGRSGGSPRAMWRGSAVLL